jgi:hypothetical protein
LPAGLFLDATRFALSSFVTGIPIRPNTLIITLPASCAAKAARFFLVLPWVTLSSGATFTEFTPLALVGTGTNLYRAIAPTGHCILFSRCTHALGAALGPFGPGTAVRTDPCSSPAVSA